LRIRIVMAGLVPAIHVFAWTHTQKMWMPATSAGMTRIVARIEPSEIRGKRVWLERRSRVSLGSIQATP
jgi:hypothetical protein